MFQRASKTTAGLVALLAVAVLAVSSCYGPHDNTPTGTGIQYKIAIFQGNNAQVTVGHTVTVGVSVTNDAGIPQRNVQVNFSVIEGTADLASTYSVTDSLGQATNQVTPTYAPGTVQVQAQIFATTTKTVITINGV